MAKMTQSLGKIYEVRVISVKAVLLATMLRWTTTLFWQIQKAFQILRHE